MACEYSYQKPIHNEGSSFVPNGPTHTNLVYKRYHNIQRRNILRHSNIRCQVMLLVLQVIV